MAPVTKTQKNLEMNIGVNGAEFESVKSNSDGASSFFYLRLLEAERRDCHLNTRLCLQESATKTGLSSLLPAPLQLCCPKLCDMFLRQLKQDLSM